MSGKGLPAGNDTGYALLDEQGITTSEFQQQVTYQRALQDELSATLEALEGVRTAVVHVALPEEEVFASDEAEPTASVLLDLAPGTTLDSGQVQAVTNLVSSSIEGMDPDQVTVADAVGATVQTVEGAPGRINRLTVSVVMDDAVAGNLNQAQIQQLVGNAVGLDAARGDDITVASMAFDTTAADAAAAELQAAQEAERQAQMWSLIRTGGIALGIALLVLVVWLRSRRKQDDEEEDYEALELADDVMAELDRIRIESTRAMPAVDDATRELEAAERARVRGEISTMVSEKPDEVAAMLRGWLSES